MIMATDFISGNFIINGHAGMWTLDRDDGSQFVNDTVSRVRTPTLCNYRSRRQISTEDVAVGTGERSYVRGLQADLILYPGMRNRSAAGNTCLSANKFAESYYENNDCIADRYMGPVPESAKAAEASYLGARNRYYMPPAFPDGCLVQHGNTSSVQSCPEGSQHGNLT